MTARGPGRPRKEISSAQEDEMQSGSETLSDADSKPVMVTKNAGNGVKFSYPEEYSDIFEDIGDFVFKQGLNVKYRISHNGEDLPGMFSHPLTMQNIVDKYGGGTIYVECRVEGKIIARRTYNVRGERKEQPVSETRTQLDDASAPPPWLHHLIPQQPSAPATPPLDLQGLAALMATVMGGSQKESAASSAHSSTEALQLKIAELQQQNMQQTFNMLAKTIESVQQSTTKMIESLAAKIEEGKKSSGSEEFSTMKLLEMRDAAYQSGYSQAMKIQELAEKKADRVLEEREVLREEAEENATPKSGIERAIETLGSLGKMLPQLPVGAGLPAMPPSVTTAAQQSRTPLRVVPQNPGAAPAVSAQRSQSGIPSHTTAARPKPTTEQISAVITTHVLPVLKPALELLEKDAATDAHAVEFSKQACAVIQAQGIAPHDALAVFRREDVLNLQSLMGLPETSKEWLNSFYDHLERESKRSRRPA